jgi:hypothetical protein
MRRITLVRALALFTLCAVLVPAPVIARETEPTGTEAPAARVPASLEDSGKPAPGDTPARMVIVTTASLTTAFDVLARQHQALGLTTRVRSLESIRDAYPAGRDDAERIRMFLEDARAFWGIDFVLLGGDEPLIPMRRAYVIPPPVVEPSVILLPTDQYYACLDGDWNADGDDRWAELANPAAGEAGDDADTVPELCVGRAPVADRAQAQLFVQKTIRALERGAPAGALDVLLAAGGLYTDQPQQPDLLSITAEDMAASVGSSTPAHFTRLYFDAALWPGAEQLTHASLLAALESGPDLSVLYGLGGPGVLGIVPDPRATVVTAQELLNSSGPRAPGHAAVLSAYTTMPGTLSIGAALIRAVRGGAVSVLGPTDIEFVIQSHAYLRGYMQQGLAGHAPTIGEAMRAVLRDPPVPPDHDIVRLTTFGNVLLGDPALPFPVGSAAAPASAASLARPSEPARDDGAAPLLGVAPNPAREAADIAYTVVEAGEGGALDVSVLDVAGRSVRTLERGAARAGSHALAWDLRDERGTRVARGLYFVRVSTRDATRVKRVVVW